MKNIYKIFLAFLVFIFLLNVVPEKQALAKNMGDEISARSYILIDENSGAILEQKNADAKMPMASITKVQTLNVIFDEINLGKLNLNDSVIISKNAAGQTGSEAFLDENKSYSIENLIKTVIISSANDSAVALAEASAGTEARFVEKMNKLAADMKLSGTHFANSTGLPAPDHYSTAADVVKMFQKLVKNETYLKYSGIWMDELIHSKGRKTELVNTNRLLKTMTECDAGKTGYTSEAKYCLVARAKREGISLIVAVLGCPTSSERFADAKTLFNIGFTNYEINNLVVQNEVYGQIKILGGLQNTVDAVANRSYVEIIRKGESAKYSIDIKLDNCKKAPIKEGDLVGKINIIDQSGRVVDIIDLVARENVDKVRFFDIFQKINNDW